MYKTASKYLNHATETPKENAREKFTKRQPSDKIITCHPCNEFINIGSIVTCTVKCVKNFGAIVTIDELTGLIHVSEMSHHWVKDPSDLLKPGDKVRAKVLAIDIGKNRLSLSIKQLSKTQPGE